MTDTHTNTKGFAGVLKHFQLMDIVQLCCLSAASLVIEVVQDAEKGRIVIRNGEIIHAQTQEHTGEEAFFQIMGWRQGKFETFDAVDLTEETIHRDGHFLLMEAARKTDDASDPKDGADAKERKKKTRVMLVEDSAVMAKILSNMFRSAEDLEVMAVVSTGEQALEVLSQKRPDLIVLDANLPGMNGSTALKHIMLKQPCPVLVMSNVSGSSWASVMNFLNLGAVDFMQKPVKNENILLQQQKILERIQRAARSNIKSFRRLPVPKPLATLHKSVPEDAFSNRVIVISSGTGGHSVLLSMLPFMTRLVHTAVIGQISAPPVLIPGICEQVDRVSPYKVVPMVEGVSILRDTVIIGTTGGRIAIDAPQGRPRIVSAPKSDDSTASLNAFDLFLETVAAHYGENAAVFLLSGAETGDLEGIAKIKSAGGTIIVQAPSSCMFPETIQTVVNQNLADHIVEPLQLSEQIQRIWPV